MTGLGTAIALAADVHRNQVDKADAPYILHCIAVMEAVAVHGEDAMIVGVLHDALEDVEPTSRLQLRYNLERTFHPRILDALDAMTHKPKGEETYDEYIERVALNYLARIVKIADLTHNMDPRRIPSYQIIDKDFARWDKYRRALIRLEREV
jgi:(p)ppGpp synthase/HD superfamily hydrolase